MVTSLRILSKWVKIGTYQAQRPVNVEAPLLQGEEGATTLTSEGSPKYAKRIH